MIRIWSLNVPECLTFKPFYTARRFDVYVVIIKVKFFIYRLKFSRPTIAWRITTLYIYICTYMTTTRIILDLKEIVSLSQKYDRTLWKNSNRVVYAICHPICDHHRCSAVRKNKCYATKYEFFFLLIENLKKSFCVVYAGLQLMH